MEKNAKMRMNRFMENRIYPDQTWISLYREGDRKRQHPARFLLGECIGTGAGCVAYRAEGEDGIPVKLKQFRPAGIAKKDPRYQGAEDRFLQAYRQQLSMMKEEKTAAVTSGLYGLYQDDSGYYWTSVSGMVGRTLDRILPENSLQKNAEIVRSVAESVKAYHEAGWLLLDVKPENILVIDSLGLHGIKLHSDFQKTALDSPKSYRIYEAIKVTENKLFVEFPQITPELPEDIHFVHAEELVQLYPGLTPKERENEIVRRWGAVFIIGIGGALSDGQPHDGRAADYDDWSSPNEEGFQGLNGDILVWNNILQRPFELSSMGIRVDEAALRRQLKIKGETWKEELPFHKSLLAGELPCTIGGGIGQSRLCMYLLRKAHIGEIQSSIWPEEMVRQCREAGIKLV